MIIRISTLLLSCLLSLTAFAQVGVNNTSPEQALDVNGKVKVGDDATRPTDGTIRYNSPEGRFEGYSRGEWKTLDEKSATPDRPIPFFASVYTTFQNEEYQVPEWQEAHGQPRDFFLPQADPAQLRANTVVPPGYTMVVDYIHVVGMSSTDDEQFLVQVAHTDGSARNNDQRERHRDEPLLYVTGSVKAGPSVLGNGRAPLLIVGAGQQLVVRNESASSNTGGVRVVFTGFLVQNLDQYFTY